jgi:CBS domain-containing protein
VVAAYPTTPIREVAETLLRLRVGAIPLVRPGTRDLVGVATQSDLVGFAGALAQQKGRPSRPR